ncbi:hypothetical protein ACSNNV_02155 [Faecalibacterium prausnitzii]|nr:hypothetical protein [Faecalibacterium prausnitzii]
MSDEVIILCLEAKGNICLLIYAIKACRVSKKQLRLVARRGLEYNKTVKEKHPFQGGDKT